MNRRFAPIFMLVVLVASFLMASRSAAEGGYPAPWTETPTMPPYVWPTCDPHCETNTPVPTDAVIAPALTPVVGVPVTWPPAVLWLPFVSR